MKCPKCNEPMKPYGEPQINAAPVTKPGQAAPVKLVCSVMNIYSCEKCPVRAVYTETVDYYPATCTNEVCDNSSQPE